ncbi:hypothetical protein D3C71_2248940 [compost metagenome]
MCRATGFHIDDDGRVVAANANPEPPVTENYFETIAVIHFQSLLAIELFQVGEERVGVA